MKSNSKLGEQNSKLSLRGVYDEASLRLDRLFRSLCFHAMTQEFGFTLIELLIVITIIGVLASLLMSNFIGVRQRARDGQRKSDLRQIQSSLELRRADQSDYPANLPGCGGSLTDNDRTTIYLQKTPCDPLDSQQYTYTKSGVSNGFDCTLSYCLITCLENSNDPQRDTTPNTTVCPAATNRVSFTLTAP